MLSNTADTYFLQVSQIRMSCLVMSLRLQVNYSLAPDEMQSGKPFLGICLGLQLMFEGSTESGGVEGLGIVPGAVAEFDRSKGRPVPHIGWNSLQERQVLHSRVLFHCHGHS